MHVFVAQNIKGLADVCFVLLLQTSIYLTNGKKINLPYMERQINFYAESGLISDFGIPT